MRDLNQCFGKPVTMFKPSRRRRCADKCDELVPPDLPPQGKDIAQIN
jgi:hypothetical protein